MRLIRWWLGSEGRYLKRCCLPSKKQIWYFAYGANMDPAVCHERKLRITEHRPFTLEGYRLDFGQPGPFVGQGFADVRPQADQVVIGSLLKLYTDDARCLDYRELEPVFHRYQRIYHQQDGVEFYFYQATHPEPGLLPTRDYLDKLLKGLKVQPDSAAHYTSRLASTKVLRSIRLRVDLGFTITRIDRWPGWIQPWLIKIERTCLLWFIHFLRNFTIFGR